MEITEKLTDKLGDLFEESSKPIAAAAAAVASTAISLAVVAIPVVAGVCYLKDRKKILNADTSSAFMNMGNGNF